MRTLLLLEQGIGVRSRCSNMRRINFNNAAVGCPTWELEGDPEGDPRQKTCCAGDEAWKDAYHVLHTRWYGLFPAIAMHASNGDEDGATQV